MIQRTAHERAIAQLLKDAPVVALLGPRQVGKTTLARALTKQRKGPVTQLDLERTTDRARLADPLLALEPMEGLVVLDEVQLAPEVFPTLRVLADRRPLPARFLVLGSASPKLLQQGSESLAGRIAFHELPGLTLLEVKPAEWKRLWRRGGFPASFTAKSEAQSQRWRDDFVRTFLQMDLPQLGIGVPAPTMQRFWTMLGHVHGQLLNHTQLGQALGVSDMTVRRYLDALVQTFMVRALKPWHANLGKREVKAPKVYLRDAGILHTLLGLQSEGALLGSPYAGASFEGFAIEQLIALLGLQEHELFFWATYQGAELDLLVMRDGQRRGFEFKLTSAPGLTKSMHIAMADLKLDTLDVIYPGDVTFPLAEKVRAVGITRLARDVGQ